MTPATDLKGGHWEGPGRTVRSSIDSMVFPGDKWIKPTQLDLTFCRIHPAQRLMHPHMEGVGPSYGGVRGLKSLGFEGPVGLFGASGW